MSKLQLARMDYINKLKRTRPRRMNALHHSRGYRRMYHSRTKAMQFYNNEFKY